MSTLLPGFESVSPTEMIAQRAKYDSDDRTRCICRHDLGRDAKEQCLNSTRHPSGICVDCRLTTIRTEDHR